VYRWIRRKRRVGLSTAADFAFLTNHGKALLVIAHDPTIRIRDIAGLLQITERATQRIVAELTKGGYIDRRREGRRNIYSVNKHMPLGLPTQRDVDIESLLAILPGRDAAAATRPSKTL
jgi:DNA-binding MarR family transcriptional regulator